MLPLFIGLATGAAIVYAATRPKPAAVAHGNEGLTPARRRVLGSLLSSVHDPAKLEKASHLFKGEGLDGPARALSSKARQVREQAVIADEWVVRARAGDQNAIGAIAATRDQAANGSKRAQVSCALIARACDANPVEAGFEEDAPAFDEDAAREGAGQFDAGEPPPAEDPPGEGPEYSAE